jgi:hypothetical protein
MVFKNNIPQPSDNMSDSQVDLLNNFGQLDTSFGVNHYKFSDLTANNGKHSFVEMVKSALIPAGLAANEGTIYTKQPVGAVSELFYTPDNSSKEYQLTRTITAQFALFATNTVYPQAPAVAFEKGGWVFLAGGIILQYGTSNPGAVSPSTGTTKFPIPFTSVPFVVQLSPISKLGGASTNNTVSVQNTTVTNTEFQWNWQSSDTRYTGFTWIAIGI